MNSLSHVAIIMDGNGRWSLKKKKLRQFGHLKGSENLKEIINFFLKKKIPYLTIFAFALDNWKRPKSEIKYIFYLLENFFKKDLQTFLDNNIKISFIGERKKLPKKILKIIKKTQKLSEKKTGLNLIIALNYSSRHEIVNAVNSIKKKNIKNISIKSFEKELYTSSVPDPEILIRSGGYCRLTNFYLWQSSYSEIFFIKKLWPDFSAKDLENIIKKYLKVKRNFGSIK